MKTPICDMFGIEFPLFGFSHCRDVVAAVTNAGGFGVLGASIYTPEQLDVELRWIEERVGGKPYGVDIVVPDTFSGKGEEYDVGKLVGRIPEGHWDFVGGILREHGVDYRPGQESPISTVFPLALKQQSVADMLDVVFSHRVGLVANALGVAPKYFIERAKREGVPVTALIGKKDHAVRQVEAGVDVLVAAGYEAGGHTGQIAVMVLVPEVVEALKGGRRVPVVAAGGIATGAQMAAAIALGADGVWTGSMWLTTLEAETSPVVKEKMVAASSSDTVLSRARTGKPARQLRTSWHEAWDRRGSPKPLPMPLQSILVEDALAQIDTAAEAGNEGARQLATYYVGQGVALMSSIRPAADVVYQMMEEFAAAVERIQEIVAEE